MAYLLDKLAEFVRQTMQAKGIKSTRDVEKLSGGRISHATVNNILSRSVADINVGTFIILADALGVPPAEMAKVVFDDHMPPWLESREFKGSDFYQLYLDYQDLAGKEKEDAAVIIQGLKEFIENRRSA